MQTQSLRQITFGLRGHIVDNSMSPRDAYPSPQIFEISSNTGLGKISVPSHCLKPSIVAYCQFDYREQSGNLF